MSNDPDRIIADLKEAFAKLETLREERERQARRAAFFRRIGVRTPRVLYKLHHHFLERKWNGQGMRRRDYFGLGCVRWLIDRTQMLTQYGELGNVFEFPSKR